MVVRLNMIRCGYTMGDNELTCNDKALGMHAFNEGQYAILSQLHKTGAGHHPILHAHLCDITTVFGPYT